MSAIHAIILGIIQGITEFLPVSSFGHEVVLADMLGAGRTGGILFETMLHLGTLVAIILFFRKDVVRILQEFVAIVLDVLTNLRIFIHNKRTGGQGGYVRLGGSVYRKLTLLLMVTTIPTALLGYAARRLVVRTSISPLMAGIGFLATGVFLIVVDFNKTNGKCTPREAKYDHAMWIGIMQGISVFPGISRCGLTMSAALLCGFTRKFAVKYSFLASIPAVIGAFFAEAGNFATPGMTVGLGFTYVLGMIVAGIVGYFAIRFLIRLIQHVKFRYFAIYSFLAGVVSLAWMLV